MPRGPLSSQLLAGLLLAGASAAILGARIVLHGETFNERTSLIVLLAGLSGGIAGLVLRPWFEDRTDWITRWQAAAAFIWVFMAAYAALYVLEFAFLQGGYLHVPSENSAGRMRITLRTLAFFLASAPTYLLPWPLPTLAVLAGVILPGWPRRSG